MAKLSKVRVQEKDLAWAAGFIDGEGCITLVPAGISRGIKDHYSLVLTVGQKDSFPLAKLKKIFGGCLHKTKQGYWEWHLAGQYAAQALRKLENYIYNKKIETEMAIMWADMPWRGKGRRNNSGTFQGRTDEEKNIDGKIAQTIKMCKTKYRKSMGSLKQVCDWALTHPNVLNYGESQNN